MSLTVWQLLPIVPQQQRGLAVAVIEAVTELDAVLVGDIVQVAVFDDVTVGVLVMLAEAVRVFEKEA